MTAPQPPALPFGTTVAFAQRALTAALHDHLVRIGTAPGTWYALNSLVLRPVIGSGALRRELAQAPDVDPSSTSELLDRLASEGLICLDADQVSLTADGEATHRRLRESITGLTAQLLSPFRSKRCRDDHAHSARGHGASYRTRYLMGPRQTRW